MASFTESHAEATSLENYEQTLAACESWKAAQTNAAVHARMDDAIEEAARINDRLRSDPEYLEGFAAGVEKEKDRHHGDCPSLLRSTFSPEGKGSGGWKRGYEDGQRLAWNLELLRRLKECFVPVPERLGQAPEDFGQEPEGLGQEPARPGQAPEGLGRAPERLGQEPAGLGPAPERRGLEPESFRLTPRGLGREPEGLGQAPEVHGLEPEGFGLEPEGFGQEPERPGRAPEGLGQAPERLGRAPERFGQ